MTAPAIFSPEALFMSSREIAELTGKRHDHVLRDIRAMLAELYGEGGVPKFEDTYINPQNGQSYPEFRLDRKHTDCLLTGYSAVARMKVITRWHELEAQPAQPTFTIPQTYAEAMRVAANLAEENDELRQENTQLKARARASDALQAVPLLERAAKSLRSAGVPKRQALQRALDLVHDQTGIQLLPGPTPSEDLTAKIVKFVRNAPRYSADKRFGHVCTQGLMPHSKLLKLVALPASDFAAVVADVIQQGILVSGKYGDFKTYSLNKTTV